VEKGGRTSRVTERTKKVSTKGDGPSKGGPAGLVDGLPRGYEKIRGKAVLGNSFAVTINLAYRPG